MLMGKMTFPPTITWGDSKFVQASCRFSAWSETDSSACSPSSLRPQLDVVAVQWFQSGSPAASSVFHFSCEHSWWWIPVTAPTLGSLAAVFLYKICIDFHNRPAPETEMNEKEQPSEKQEEDTEISTL